MENFVLSQVQILSICILSGAIIGIYFDIFRILRKTFKTSDIITYLEDILFWLFTGIFILFILFKYNNGEIRVYNLIGLIIGVILYMLAFSSFFIKSSVYVITFIKKIILYFIKFIIRFIEKIFNPFIFLVINIKKKKGKN